MGRRQTLTPFTPDFIQGFLSGICCTFGVAFAAFTVLWLRLTRSTERFIPYDYPQPATR